MRFARLMAAILVLQGVFAAEQARPQDSSDCRGIVLDENGVPVVAAQVRLEDSAGHSHRTETDLAGRFAIRNLPSGDYKAEVHKKGFFVLSGQAVSLHTGSNEVSLVLSHEQEVREKVQVTASSNQIDTQDTAQRSTLSAQEIRDIPVPSSHVLQESLVALPEIVQDRQDNLHVAGARSGETQYMLDGFEIGDPVSGALTSRFNIDATRAAEVQTARIDASYPHSGANILSLVTPDGDDRWRFGTTNPGPGINIQQEGVHLGDWYPRFAFSGPFVRGRFWFSDSISVQHAFGVVKQLRPGPDTFEDWAGDNLLRLQYNFSPKHILHASVLYNRANDGNLGLDALDPQSTTVTADQRRGFVSLKDQIWLHETLVDLGVAADEGVLEYTPQGSLPYILLINGTGGNYFQHLRQRGRRLQAVMNVTAASRHWHGTHQLSVGANVAGLILHQSAQRGEIDAFRATNALDGTTCTATSPTKGCQVRQTRFIGSATPQLSNTQAGAFAQDIWSVGRHFVFQAGLRTDWDRFTQSAMGEPRVSANVLPFGDDRAKLSFGWGIYNAPLNLALIGQVVDQQQLDTFFFDSSGNPLVMPSTVTSQFVVPGSVSQPRFATSSASWQEKFGRNTLVSLDLLARNGSHGFAFVDQQPSQPGGIFLLEDQRQDRYRSATFSARHVFSESTEIYAAYTRSKAHSNEVLNPALGSIFYAAQRQGPVAWDTPNRLVLWGWVPTRIWSTHLSGFLEYRSGYPFSVVNLQQQLVGAPNASRFPAYASLNLGLERKFELRGYLWAVRVEGVNILGRQNPDSVVNNIDAPKCGNGVQTGCFGAFAGGQGRATTLRVRFVGRK
jgi:hypothetical protein